MKSTGLIASCVAAFLIRSEEFWLPGRKPRAKCQNRRFAVVKCACVCVTR